MEEFRELALRRMISEFKCYLPAKENNLVECFPTRRSQIEVLYWTTNRLEERGLLLYQRAEDLSPQTGDQSFERERSTETNDLYM